MKKALGKGNDISIRGEWNDSTIFKPNTNGLIDIAFQKFMVSKGYDGMIYREGGEGKDKEPLTSYVFYNPRVVDTWEGWNKRKTS